MDNDNTFFRLTFEDAEFILERKLTDDEKDLLVSKFSLETWTEELEVFFEINDID